MGCSEVTRGFVVVTFKAEMVAGTAAKVKGANDGPN